MRSDLICQRLTSYEPLRVPTRDLRSAAVLVPLLPDAAGSCDVVLTRRATSLRQHAGQIAFPGGRIDPTDTSAEAAALREMREELGVAPTQVTPFARLDEIIAITGFHIVPIVGMLATDCAFAPNADEVARVFTVPMRELLRTEQWEQREHVYHGHRVDIWHFAWADEDIWGVTGAILRGLVELLW